MATLKMPSVQHLAKHWAPTAEEVARNLIGLVLNPPTFSYSPLNELARDILVLGHPIEAVLNRVSQRVRHPIAKKNYLEILPLIHSSFSEVNPDFVNAMGARQYPVAQNLLVPFAPPLIYGVRGKVILPWFSFWRSDPLEGDNLSLFTTLACEMLEQDPDLENANFEILDFSAPDSKSLRELKLVDAHTVARIDERQKREMLEVFVAGFRMAETVVAKLEKPPRKGVDDQPPQDDLSGRLFP